jgi:PHP family Zn ribbon phosphoesterase
MELSYPSLRSALKNGRGARPGSPRAGPPGIVETIELFPQEGKYYHDGHRKCGVQAGPGEALAGGGICPVCGRALTRGVLGRVLELADRPPSSPAGADRRPYRSQIPLKELLGEILQVGAASKKVEGAYAWLIEAAGPELFFLLETPLGEIRRLRCPGLSGELLGDAVARMRSGELFISPGYDGEYGRIRALSPAPRGNGLT